MNWKTSNSGTRHMIGLQFFAEEGESLNSGESLDDGFAEGFEEGFAGVEDDQLDTIDEPADEPEGEPEEDPEQPEQPQEERPGEPEQPEEPETPKDKPAEAFVPLTFNGQQVSLPESAVSALSAALGGDAVSLLQKGLNYENRGAREISILDRYAEASGYNSRAAYLEAMEQSLGTHQVEAELTKLMEQYPDTPAEALRPIAERTVKDRSAEEKAQNDLQAQERAQEEMRRAGEEKARPWAEFIRLHPELNPKELGTEFYDLVTAGIPPVAAYERMEAEKAKNEAAQLREQLKAAQKNTRNRQAAVGSMTDGALDGDPFLEGFGRV